MKNKSIDTKPLPIAKLIFSARIKKGLTVRELSKLTEMSVGALSGYELGKHVPRVRGILKLNRVLELGLSAEDIERIIRNTSRARAALDDSTDEKCRDVGSEIRNRISIPTEMSLGGRIAYVRKMLGYTQKSLGEACGVKTNQVFLWENDQKHPGAMQSRIEELLGPVFTEEDNRI